MKDHLLSIFPLPGMEDFARVSCIPLEEVATDCTEPFTASRADVIGMLAESFDVAEARALLGKLDGDQPVQVAITTEQARLIGFVPKVN